MPQRTHVVEAEPVLHVVHGEGDVDGGVDEDRERPPPARLEAHELAVGAARPAVEAAVLRQRRAELGADERLRQAPDERQDRGAGGARSPGRRRTPCPRSRTRRNTRTRTPRTRRPTRASARASGLRSPQSSANPLCSAHADPAARSGRAGSPQCAHDTPRHELETTIIAYSWRKKTTLRGRDGQIVRIPPPTSRRFRTAVRTRRVLKDAPRGARYAGRWPWRPHPRGVNGRPRGLRWRRRRGAAAPRGPPPGPRCRAARPARREWSGRARWRRRPCSATPPPATRPSCSARRSR